MEKYRKIPVVIEAEQWWRCRYDERGKYHLDVMHFVVEVDQSKKDNCKHCGQKMINHGWIKTLEGGHIVCSGDWIITGIEGEKYPCKPNIFDKTYEKVKDKEFLID